MAGHRLNEFLIPLTSKLHKGDCGRICIIGGSKQYHGAPYYAAKASLYLGADLASVVCAPEAAMPIKALSPELLVYPILGTELLREENQVYVRKIIGKNDVFVCGPGLGNEKDVLEDARLLVHEVLNRNLPLIVDGDGIKCFLEWKLVSNENVIITPNHREVQLMRVKLEISEKDKDIFCKISNRLGNAIIIGKDSIDTICKQDTMHFCNEEGSLKRCGGQGDILTGVLATLWHHYRRLGPTDRDELAFCQKACEVMRFSARRAYDLYGRTCSASDVLESLRQVVIEDDIEHGKDCV